MERSSIFIVSGKKVAVYYLDIFLGINGHADRQKSAESRVFTIARRVKRQAWKSEFFRCEITDIHQILSCRLPISHRILHAVIAFVPALAVDARRALVWEVFKGADLADHDAEMLAEV